MDVHLHFSELSKRQKPVVLAAGFFDGLHIGHREVIGRAMKAAAEIDGESWILTFNNHPLSILAPDKAPPLLTSNKHKMRLLQEIGVDGCLVMHFTPEFAETEPADFVNEMISHAPNLRKVYVGQNWRFGSGGKGNPAVMAEICGEHGIEVVVVEHVETGNETVSSTAIRAAIDEGDFEKARKLLGRRYSFLGKVVPGRSVGRRIGFPTANLRIENDLPFPAGVYAVKVMMEDETESRDGVLSYGNRPTFFKKRGIPMVPELYLPGVDEDLYRRRMEVYLIERLRGEVKFESIEELKKQISNDVDQALKILSEIALHD